MRDCDRTGVSIPASRECATREPASARGFPLKSIGPTRTTLGIRRLNLTCPRIAHIKHSHTTPPHACARATTSANALKNLKSLAPVQPASNSTGTGSRIYQIAVFACSPCLYAKLFSSRLVPHIPLEEEALDSDADDEAYKPAVPLKAAKEKRRQEDREQDADRG
ncbi:hypothetical protein BDZ89DRAFT_1141732 [Hymenopellis radicata]|nr:hypothetical protein BDZ89DRAFT_1141732 [Hymenopellis radicata]